MDCELIMQRLGDFIRTRYDIPAGDADFNEDVHLFDYGYVDSFGAVDLLTFVETTFDITISQSDLIAYPLNTIREIALFVQGRQKGPTNVATAN